MSIISSALANIKKGSSAFDKNKVEEGLVKSYKKESAKKFVGGGSNTEVGIKSVSRNIKKTKVGKGVGYSNIVNQLNGILDTTNGIKNTLLTDYANEVKKNRAEKRIANAEKRRKKEDDLESKSSKKKGGFSVPGFISKPVSSIFDWILNFLGMTILGSLVNLGLKNFDNISKFFKDITGSIGGIGGGLKFGNLFWLIRAALYKLIIPKFFIKLALRGLGLLLSPLKLIAAPFMFVGGLIFDTLKFVGNTLYNWTSKIVNKITNIGKFILSPIGKGARWIGKGISRVFGGVGKGVGKVLSFGKRMISKIFGKGVSKFLTLNGKIFKQFGKVFKASSGFAKRIPVIGPLMVAAVSMISGDPIDETLFKSIGAALGGAIGSFIPIPLVGMIMGEMVGQFVGELLYDGFRGKGWGSAGDRLKKKLKDLFQGGKETLKWIGNGFGSFSNKFMEKHSFQIPNSVLNALKWIPGIPDWIKDWNGKLPNLLKLFNPYEWSGVGSMLLNSFFPDGFINTMKSVAGSIFEMKGGDVSDEKDQRKDRSGKVVTDDPSTGGPGGTFAVGGSYEMKLKNLLASYEGLRLKAYPDANYKWEVPTIGIGATFYPPGFRLTGKVKKGDTITKEEAYWIKDQHIKSHRQRLFKEITPGEYSKLPDGVKAALESKVFNYGSLGSTLTGLVKEAVKTGDYSQVEAYFRNTLAFHNDSVNDWRRNDEADLIAHGKSKRAKINFGTAPTPLDKLTKKSPESSTSVSRGTGDLDKFSAGEGLIPSDNKKTPSQGNSSSITGSSSKSSSPSSVSTYASYEKGGDDSNTIVVTLPNRYYQSGSESSSLPILAMDSKSILNSYYKSQLVGFLYKQG